MKQSENGLEVEKAENSNEESTAAEEEGFRPGDHVYYWCSFARIPRMLQHHGIVLDVSENGDELTVVDFFGQSSKSVWAKGGRIRASEREDSSKWRRVEYEAALWKRALYRTGTCTAMPCDPPGLVLSRVRFLLENPEGLLPPYDLCKANCECVAVWCKTGVWATLQAAAFLSTTAMGQAKSATTLAVVASSAQVTVPSAGVWGWLGYTTKVSLVSTQPMLLPAIAGYGLLTVGGPMLVLARSRKFWDETSKRLNDQFWQSAIDHPDVFVECITEWSNLK